MKVSARKIAVLVALVVVLASMPAMALATELSLTTLYDKDNDWDGIFFDIGAVTDITLSRLDTNIYLAGGPYPIEIYTKSGTHAGFEKDPGAWTLVGTAVVSSDGPDVPVPIPIDLSSISILAGETQALYITGIFRTIAYTNGTEPGNLFIADDNLQIFEGLGAGYGWTNNTSDYGSGSASARIFNGTIYYARTEFPLEISAGEGGSVTDISGDYLSGTPLEATATPDSGYYFTGWTATGLQLSDDAANPLSFNMPNNTVVLVANFEEDSAEETVDIFYLASGGGSVTLEHESIASLTGEPVGSTAVVEAGYEFLGWLGVENDEFSVIVSVDPHFVPSRNENGVYVEAKYLAVFAPLDEEDSPPVTAPVTPPTGDTAAIGSILSAALVGFVATGGVLVRKRFKRFD